MGMLNTKRLSALVALLSVLTPCVHGSESGERRPYTLEGLDAFLMGNKLVQNSRALKPADWKRRSGPVPFVINLKTKYDIFGTQQRRPITLGYIEWQMTETQY